MSVLTPEYRSFAQLGGTLESWSIHPYRPGGAHKKSSAESVFRRCLYRFKIQLFYFDER